MISAKDKSFPVQVMLKVITKIINCKQLLSGYAVPFLVSIHSVRAKRNYSFFAILISLR